MNKEAEVVYVINIARKRVGYLNLNMSDPSE